MNVSPAHIAIAGAGPAGLMAAEVLAAAGHRVTIYERMPSAGRKLLMAGRGGLNLTHSESLPQFLARYGSAAPWMERILRDFPPEALVTWAHGLGQETFTGSSGRVFPKSLKASPLLRAWLRRLDEHGVTLKLRHRFEGWDRDGRLRLAGPKGEPIAVVADAVLLALGGASWPRLGANGAWTGILTAEDVNVMPLSASNCGVLTPWSPVFRDRFEGAPLKRIGVCFDGTDQLGEAVVTKSGLEGGAVYAHTSALRAAIGGGRAAFLQIDLRPGLTGAELARRLSAPRGKQSTSNFLRKAGGLAPVAIGLLREASANTLPAAPEALANLIKRLPLTVTGIAGLERAISSAGGIGLDALDTRLMLKAKPGVFAAGEMLDWDAPTGGYLLQATLATAVTAAHGIMAWISEKRSMAPATIPGARKVF